MAILSFKISLITNYSEFKYLIKNSQIANYNLPTLNYNEFIVLISYYTQLPKFSYR